MDTHEMIKILRENLGLSQEVLAEKVGYKDRSSIAKVEAGLVDLSQSKIALFADALGVSPARLMGIDKNNPPAQVDEGIWKSICANKTKLMLAAWVAGLDHEELLQVAKVLSAILGKEIPPSALE